MCNKAIDYTLLLAHKIIPCLSHLIFVVKSKKFTSLFHFRICNILACTTKKATTTSIVDKATREKKGDLI